MATRVNGILKAAIKEAKRSNSYPYLVGAVIFKNGRIFSLGHNSRRYSHKLHPRFKFYDEGLCAEKRAILNSRRDLKGLSILVVRLNVGSESLGMAKPCPFCEKYLKYVGITDVWYTDRSGNITREKYHLDN